MLNGQATALGSSISDADRPDLYPVDNTLREEIESLNNTIYTSINKGAYKAGFSSDQAVYAIAFNAYFDALSKLDAMLAADGRSFLTDEKFIEADLRLFPTLYRHDPVYYIRMKLNGAKILDFPNLWRWLCRVCAIPGVAQSNSRIMASKDTLADHGITSFHQDRFIRCQFLKHMNIRNWPDSDCKNVTTQAGMRASTGAGIERVGFKGIA